MSFVIFENRGEIDIRAIKTFGVSAKETENPIGFFGTGMKYAIAICLREGMKVKLQAGEKTYVFTKLEQNMRGKEYEIVMMDDVELPFTTHLGVNWETWQAFREFYCNCLDESGTTDLVEKGPEPEAGVTRFIVQGEAMTDCWTKRDSIVISPSPELRAHQGLVDIYQLPSKYVYYRGIRVMGFDREAMFTYNVLRKIDLTEDRTVRNVSEVMAELSKEVARMNDKGVIRQVITAPKHLAESQFSWSWLGWFLEPSAEFVQVLSEEYNSNNDNLHRELREYFRKLMDKQALKNYSFEKMSNVQEKQLERAKTVLRRCFPDFGDYKILIVKTLGQQTMAMADMNERAIVLSKASFEMGTKYLVSTMLEEYLHLKSGQYDLTRAFQTAIFDSMCSLIEDHVIMEPL